MKKLLLSLSAIAMLTVMSCNKDNDDVPQEVTPTKENLTGTYRITAATMTSGSSTVDIFNNDSFFEACQRDDNHKLNADLSYEMVDAGTQCTPSGTYTATWNLTGSTTIEIDGTVGTIKSFDGRTLVVTATDMGMTVTFTYVKQ